MKKKIHPSYVETKVTCACGNSFTVKSNRETLSLEACNKCHPGFNGSNVTVAKKTGAVDKFNRKYNLQEK